MGVAGVRHRAAPVAPQAPHVAPKGPVSATRPHMRAQGTEFSACAAFLQIATDMAE
jgi:hypothetical protein